MNSFERKGNILDRLDIGGFSFNTMKIGSILESKKYFGVSKNTGNIGGYHSSSIQISRGNYFLVTEIKDGFKSNTKTIHWIKYRRLDLAKEARENLKKHDRTRSIKWYGIKIGFFQDLTKRRFDYRFDIIETGFNESEIRKRNV